jgi:phage baseplate assembly protein W
MTQVAFPFRFDGRGLTAQADEDRHVRELIEQLLLTGPGERVMRPEFGSGLMQLVFAGNSPELAATTQFLIQGALQTWLGDVIAIEGVEVESVDSVLTVEVRYVNRRTRTREVARVTAPGTAP